MTGGMCCSTPFRMVGDEDVLYGLKLHELAPPPATASDSPEQQPPPPAGRASSADAATAQQLLAMSAGDHMPARHSGVAGSAGEGQQAELSLLLATLAMGGAVQGHHSLANQLFHLVTCRLPEACQHRQCTASTELIHPLHSEMVSVGQRC